MTCRELVQFLLEYLSGELAADERAAFDAHLRECAKCVAYVSSYQEAVRLGIDACAHPGAPVPEDVPDELVEAILEARRTRG